MGGAGRGGASVEKGCTDLRSKKASVGEAAACLGPSGRERTPGGAGMGVTTEKRRRSGDGDPRAGPMASGVPRLADRGFRW